jgi:hypothetical protein
MIMHARFYQEKTKVFILQGLACMLRILFGPLNFYLAIFFRVFYFYGCLSLQLVGLLNIIARLLIVKQVKLLHLTFCQDRADGRRGERFTYWKKNYLHRKSYTIQKGLPRISGQGVGAAGPQPACGGIFQDIYNRA